MLLGGIASQPKHFLKYTKVYLNQGFDVMMVNFFSLQSPFPKLGVQKIARYVLKLLLVNECYQKILIHGFCLGTYIFGEWLLEMRENLSLYERFIDRIKAQVWDSPMGFIDLKLNAINNIVPIMAGNSPKLQRILKIWFSFHRYCFYFQTTKVYYRSVKMFDKNDIIATPALFLYSKADQVVSSEEIIAVAELWTKNGIKVRMKSFEDSSHVRHILKYKLEYVSTLHNFLDEVGLMRNSKVTEETNF